MGIFDLIKTAKSEALAKAETLQKKVEEAAEQLAAGKLPTPKKKDKPVSAQRKKAAPKPDRSIQGISAQTMKQRDSMIRNGIKQYEFIANSNCCEACAALNGKHFPISKLAIGVNAPPMHDGCRCSIAAHMDDEEYDAWLDHLDKGGTTAEWERMKKKKR